MSKEGDSYSHIVSITAKEGDKVVEKQIDFENDMLFINTQTGEIGIGEVIDAEYVREGFRGRESYLPDMISVDVNWKVGDMMDVTDTVSSPKILKLSLKKFLEPSPKARKSSILRRWPFGKKNK